MPRFLVEGTRWASVRQSAEVYVSADTAEEAEEIFWDMDLNWMTIKVIDSDDHDAEAVFVGE